MSQTPISPGRFAVAVVSLFAQVFSWQGVAQDVQKGAQESSPFRLSVSARLVPVDVVVTDKKGIPVQGLKREAFHIVEDSVPQPIKAFEEHGAAPTPSVALPPMGPGMYTNLPTARVSDSITVLLLDSLNTNVADQAYVHQQILDFLKTVPAGSQVAIFTLASRLRMLQSPTTDPAVLTAVLKSKRTLPKGSVFAGSEFDPAVNASTSITDPSLAVETSLGSFNADFQVFQQQQRVNISLQALQELGDFLAGIPGRKNLVWFAGDFPLGLSAEPTGSDPSTDLTPDQAERRALIDAYIRGRISVYPVSATGLQANSLTSASQSNRGFASSPQSVTQASLQQANNRANEQIPMEKLAEDTGGKAFFDSNGLKQAIETAVREGDHFYSIAYVPADHEFDERFHRISVTVDGNYKVSYRRGYYADGPDGIAASIKRTSGYSFEDAMMRGAPNATAILFKVHVGEAVRPEGSALLGDHSDQLMGKTKRYVIDYAASMRNLRVTRSGDGVHHLSLEFAAVVYDIDGKPLNSLTQQVKLDLKPDALTDFLKTGLKYQQVIDAPAAPFFLKVGITDPSNGKTGTMEIPIQPEK